MASKSSLTSIPEAENEDDEDAQDSHHYQGDGQRKNLNLKWGHVEEYCPNDDTESRASSGNRSDAEEVEEEEEEEEEDDGWGWFEQDANTSNNSGNGTNGNGGEKERRQSRSESLSSESGRTQKERKPLVRVLSQSTPLDPLVGGESTSTSASTSLSGSTESSSQPSGGSLLLLGSDQWPERRTRRRRNDRAFNGSTFGTGSAGEAKGDSKLSEGDLSGRNRLLEAFVLETRSKGWPITMSAFLIFSRGAATGYALRAIPHWFFRVACWFYSDTSASNSNRDAIRTGMFLGLTMTTYHIMAMNNVATGFKKNKDGTYSLEDSGEVDETGAPIENDSWIPVTAAMLTPLLAILPGKSRLSMSLFVAARATEALINGLLYRLSRNVREQIPVAKWLFSLGSAQVVFAWLFHRSTLPSELATFLDKASSVRPDARLVELLQSPNKANYEEALKVIQTIVYPVHGDPLLKRILLGSGLIEFMASDVFSAASLFGPVFAFPLEFSSSFARGARSALVLITDAMLSGFALIALSKLLRRVAPSNGWWAGFVAGLVAVQLENRESRRVEIALFALIYAVRAIYNLAAERHIIPSHVKFGEFGLYFASLVVVLKAATISPVRRVEPDQNGHKRRKSPSKARLILGPTFRTLIKRCIIPG